MSTPLTHHQELQAARDQANHAQLKLDRIVFEARRGYFDEVSKLVAMTRGHAPLAESHTQLVRSIPQLIALLYLNNRELLTDLPLPPARPPGNEDPMAGLDQRPPI
jgi:hypothetical protein